MTATANTKSSERKIGKKNDRIMWAGWAVAALSLLAAGYILIYSVEEFGRIVVGLSWPAALVALLVLYRAPITQLINRILLRLIRLPGVALEFGEAETDRLNRNDAPTPSDASQSLSFDKGKPGNMYWLSHDLRWTVELLLRGGNGDLIRFGLQQILFHMQQLGLTESGYYSQVQSLRQQALLLGDADWTSRQRDRFSREIARVAVQLGKSIQREQRDFKGKPEPGTVL